MSEYFYDDSKMTKKLQPDAQRLYRGAGCHDEELGAIRVT